MTREDVIRLAQEAGMSGLEQGGILENFERFAALVAEKEREACASICFQEGPSIDGELIANAIRARNV